MPVMGVFMVRRPSYVLSSRDEYIRTFRGQRDLAGLSQSVSSTRMLNLHQLWMDQPSDPDYELKPFFAHPMLNRAIILKHNMRRGEEEKFLPRRLGATKLVLPLDVLDLGLGAQYLIAGQSNFIPLLTQNLDYTNLPMERDLRLIEMLDSLPTLDPFLLDQMAKHYHLDIARCYFRMSQADIDSMAEFVLGEIEPLVVLCLGLDTAASASGRGSKLSGLLMSNDENSEALAILREGLRMQPSEFSQAIFAWKALLFYKWRMAELAPRARETASGIGKIKMDRQSRKSVDRYIGMTKARISEAMSSAWTDAASIIAEYDKVYNALIAEGKPEMFRRFLLSAPHLFMSLGDRIGRLEHVSGFWMARFERHVKPLPPEELCDMLMDLDRSLASELKLPDLYSPRLIAEQITQEPPTIVSDLSDLVDLDAA